MCGGGDGRLAVCLAVEDLGTGDRCAGVVGAASAAASAAGTASISAAAPAATIVPILTVNCMFHPWNWALG